MSDDQKKDNELQKIEDQLLKEEEEKKKKPMPISGRSVFEIQRINKEKSTK